MKKKEQLKVAVVNQGLSYSSFPKPTDSIGIVINELVHCLVEKCDFLVYTPGSTLLIKTEYHGAIN